MELPIPLAPRDPINAKVIVSYCSDKIEFGIIDNMLENNPRIKINI